jgi:hypothetical protein
VVVSRMPTDGVWIGCAVGALVSADGSGLAGRADRFDRGGLR